MKTSNFAIFQNMVDIAKEKNLKYELFYSHRTRNATNNCTEVYAAVLYTELFSVSWNRTISETDAMSVDRFLRENGTELNCTISVNDDGIELS